MEILQTLQDLPSLIQNLDNSTLVLLASIFIMLITFLATITLSSLMLRVGFLMVLGASSYLLAHTFKGIQGEFFLNLSTEFIGAIIALVILAEWIQHERFVFPIVVIVVLALVIVTGYITTERNLSMNIRTDLLGAFLVFMLLNRHWLIDSKRERKARRRYEQLEKEWELSREVLIRNREAILQRWDESTAAHWDIQIRIIGKNKTDLDTKVAQLERVLGEVRLIRDRKGPKPGLVNRTLVAVISWDKTDTDEIPVVTLPGSAKTKPSRASLSQTPVPASRANGKGNMAANGFGKDDKALREMATMWQRKSQYTQRRIKSSHDKSSQKVYEFGAAKGYEMAAQELLQHIQAGQGARR